MTAKKILIVDDNDDLANGLALILEDYGHDISIANSGMQAVQSISTGNFDVVLLDIKLPDMTGFDVFRALHSISPDTRVIIMTGYRLEQMMKQIMNDGDVSIFYDPFEADLLVEPVKNDNNVILTFSNNPDVAQRILDKLRENNLTTKYLEHYDSNDVSQDDDYDVIVLKMRYPILCAITAYIDLSRLGRTHATVIIVEYDSNNISSIDAAKTASITGCLLKPFDPEAVIDAVNGFQHIS